MTAAPTLAARGAPTLSPHLVPVLSFAHLRRLSDDTGLFEHARNAIVRREHGYCTDDVSRGLLVVSREPDPGPELLRLAECYLTYLNHAAHRDGSFHNRLSLGRRWTDEPSLGDWWGRALWGLGTAAAHSTAGWIREEALATFRVGATRRSPFARAMVFAGLGAAEVLRRHPRDEGAAALLADAADAVGPPRDDWPDWVWPQQRLTYANAALAEVTILAGQHAGDAALLDRGLRMLAWLHDAQTVDGRLSMVAVAGWQRHGPRERYDQQSIEVAALADACASAARVTGDPAWNCGVQQAVAWFAGHNDQQAPMWDPATGGGYDGLTPHGPNRNQGAESTLALLSTLQHHRRLADTGGPAA